MSDYDDDGDGLGLIAVWPTAVDLRRQAERLVTRCGRPGRPRPDGATASQVAVWRSGWQEARDAEYRALLERFPAQAANSGAEIHGDGEPPVLRFASGR